MDRVFEANVSATPPSAPASPAAGYPRAGNPSTGTEATKLGPYWYHMITESLRKLIVDAGLTPDHTNLNLVSQAVQAMIAGGSANDYKTSVRFTTTGNIVLSGLGTQAGGDWGAALTAGDRILSKDQTTGSQNGIYIAAAGAWVRATDADGVGELTSGAVIAVEEGATLADSQWMLTADGAITIGTTALTFARKDGSTVPDASTTVKGKVQLATAAVTQGGTNGTDAVTSTGLAATMLGGVGQAYTDVTGSRAAGTNYTNSTGRPIEVQVNTTIATNGRLQPTVDGVALPESHDSVTGGSKAYVSFMVPNGKVYSVAVPIGSIEKWVELR